MVRLKYKDVLLSDTGDSMNIGTGCEDTMRQKGEWMAPVDDRILELIRNHGNLTPAAVDHFGGPSRHYASERMSVLANYGLLEQIYRGLYGITDDGRQYLDEQLDASELEPIDSTDS